MSGVGASSVVMMEKQLRGVHPRVLSRARRLLLIVAGDVDFPFDLPCFVLFRAIVRGRLAAHNLCLRGAVTALSSTQCFRRSPELIVKVLSYLKAEWPPLSPVTCVCVAAGCRGRCASVVDFLGHVALEHVSGPGVQS